MQVLLDLKRFTNTLDNCEKELMDFGVSVKNQRRAGPVSVHGKALQKTWSAK
jgi:hypothetical protein